MKRSSGGSFFTWRDLPVGARASLLQDLSSNAQLRNEMVAVFGSDAAKKTGKRDYFIFRLTSSFSRMVDLSLLIFWIATNLFRQFVKNDVDFNTFLDNAADAMQHLQPVLDIQSDPDVIFRDVVFGKFSSLSLDDTRSLTHVPPPKQKKQVPVTNYLKAVTKTKQVPIQRRWK